MTTKKTSTHIRVHIAKNGRFYVRLPGGQTQFISELEAERLRSTSASASSSAVGPAAEMTSLIAAANDAIDFSDRQVGVILRGFVEAARGDDDVDEVARLFGMTAASEGGDVGDAGDRLLRDVGREIFRHMPAAMTFFNVPSEEWATWYDVFLRRRSDRCAARGSTRCRSRKRRRRFSRRCCRRVGVDGAGGGRVLQRFGPGHAGIDVACSIGCSIVAPIDMRVTKVGFDTDGGYVVANALRDDGSFDGDGYRLLFARLGEVDVVEGLIVRRGAMVARSAVTGTAHDSRFFFAVERVESSGDKTFVVDPLSLVPEAMLVGTQPLASPTDAQARDDEGPLRDQVIPIAVDPNHVAHFATGDEGSNAGGDPLDGID